MDLLRNAYGNSSDEEPQPKPGPRKPEPEIKTRTRPDHRTAYFLPLKRPKPENHDRIIHTETPLPGRYISKRERALLGQPSDPGPNSDPKHNDPSSVQSPVTGSIADTDLPRDVVSSIRQAKGRVNRSQLPEKLSIALRGHTKAVNALQWSTSHAHLLASAGMDCSVYVWNVWSQREKTARVFKFHKAAVKDVKWSPHGSYLLSSGYDCCSRLTDVNKGVGTQIFKEEQVVGSIKFHPENPSLFLSGGSKGHLKLWDIRTGKVVHEYIRQLGSILDVEFINNGKQFISSSDVSGSNVSENSIIVWDVSRQVPLSNQVYVEAYTCPCIKAHPYEPSFVAQSNGNYIAIFSTSPPFKLDKYKRYEGHGVFGFPIKINFSSNGEKLVSGSSDGSVYFYHYRSSQLVKRIDAYENYACMDVAWHPVLSNVVASCSWNGDVSVFE